jgi:hypothetical protein
MKPQDPADIEDVPQLEVEPPAEESAEIRASVRHQELPLDLPPADPRQLDETAQDLTRSRERISGGVSRQPDSRG